MSEAYVLSTSFIRRYELRDARLEVLLVAHVCERRLDRELRVMMKLLLLY